MEWAQFRDKAEEVEAAFLAALRKVEDFGGPVYAGVARRLLGIAALW
jgi:hypothetical protein